MAEAAVRRHRRKHRGDVEPLTDTESDISSPPEPPTLENFTAWSEETDSPLEVLAENADQDTETVSGGRHSKTPKPHEEPGSRSGTPSGSLSMLQKMKKNVITPCDVIPTEDISGVVNPTFVREKTPEAWDHNNAEKGNSRPNSAPTSIPMKELPRSARPTSAPMHKIVLDKQLIAKDTGVAHGSKQVDSDSVRGSQSSLYAWGTTKERETYENHKNSLPEMDGVKSSENSDLSKVISSQPRASSGKMDEGSSQSATGSSNMLAPPEALGEQHAYVPLDYARECIAKVVDDMKRMRAKHVSVVEQIQTQYKAIEEDTQGQFNAYVLQLRTEYNNKITTFRKMIEMYQNEIQKKQAYWEGMVNSLRQSNKKLLQEKKDLLIKNRSEYDEIEEEKVQALNNLTSMLDKKHSECLSVTQRLKEEEESWREKEAGYRELKEKHEASIAALKAKEEEHEASIAALKAKEEEVNELRTSHESLKLQLEEAEQEKVKLNTSLQEGSEEIKKENEKLKAEVNNLKEKLVARPLVVGVAVDSAISPTAVSDTPVTSSRIESQQDVTVAATVATVATPQSGDSEDVLELKNAIAKLENSLQVLQQEKGTLRNENRTFQTEISALKSSQIENELAVASLQQKNNELRQKLQSAVDQVTAGADAEDLQLRLQTALRDKAVLEEETDDLQREIDTWRQQYMEDNDGAEPTEEDRSEAIQGAYQQITENEQKISVVKNDIAFVEMVLSGEVQESQSEENQLNAKYEEKIAELERENQVLREEMSELRDKIDSMETRRDNLELEESSTEVTLGQSDSVPFDSEGLRSEIEELNQRIEELNAEHDEELSKIKQELETSVSKVEALLEEKEGVDNRLLEVENSIKRKDENIASLRKQYDEEIRTLKKKIKKLEDQKLANLPVEAVSEIKALKSELESEIKKRQLLQTEYGDLKDESSKLEVKLEGLNHTIERLNEKEVTLKDEMQKTKKQHEEELSTVRQKALQAAKTQPSKEDRGKIIALERKVEDLKKKLEHAKQDTAPAASAVAVKKDTKGPSTSDEKLKKENDKLLEKLEAYKKRTSEDSAKIKQLEKDLREAKEKASKAGPSTEEKMASKKQEKQLKELQKQLENEKKRTDKYKTDLTKTEEDLAQLKKDLDAVNAESKKDKEELSKLGVAAMQGVEALAKVEELESKVKELGAENKTLAENYNSERVLRKKYYNMVEDMKGKIRVYARSRPLSKSELERGNFSIIKSPDEYTLLVDTARGAKEFQYDQVFTDQSTQDKIFEDVSNLIQSAVDGYNVCIFAYGQTGSGKTFTMIGDKEQRFPGIAPRSFKTIYEVIQQNKNKFSFRTELYMLELYMDKLIDLFAVNKDAKLDIKKDKKGMVVVSGAQVLEASNEVELMELFEKGSSTRHISSTKMNAESSRSHLIVSVIIESTNLTTGAVTKGKLSLVDLAGSERAAKTGASPEQLKEAQSINKSLSALGDVISALSSDQSFIPYRNNKLTLLMQDSLGGNAKTLMFVNISPADYNGEETVTSLTYASRVKLITNDASKNAESKEVARLKGIISKLKKGESIEEEEEE